MDERESIGASPVRGILARVPANGGLPVLSTPRLVLRALAAVDFDALHAIWSESSVRRYLFDDVAVSRERSADVFALHVAMLERRLGVWTIRERAARDGEGPVIGCVGLCEVGGLAGHDPARRREVEPVVALAPVAWKRGFAVEALARALRYAFDDLGLESLVAAADAPNVASQRMLERAGFVAAGECEGPREPLKAYRLSRADFAALVRR